jgi:hypothetical protein
LEFTPSTKEAMPTDGFDFEFFFSVHNVWGWSREVDAILGRLAIRSQQTCVEDVMNGPGRGKFQSISNR